MKNSLFNIKTRYEELSEKLTNPDIISDIKKYKKINFEVKMVEDIVKAFNLYIKYENSLNEAKTALKSESDQDLIQMVKAEVNELEEKMPKLEEELKILLVPKDPNDEKNIIVEIRGAAGGDEANIFAGDLFEMYRKWASNNNFKLIIIEQTKSQSGGFTLIVFKVDGEKVYSKLKYETGVHRVQRIPKTETQGRVHTSTATITVMPEADETTEIEINPSDLKIDTFRASGAGGQHINTTDSAVRITHLPTNVVASSQEGRSQIANREVAMTLLRSKLLELEIKKEQQKNASFRKLAGAGFRSEKIRTYNYPQDRVTDHRISYSTSLKGVVDGNINELIDNLLAKEKEEKINESQHQK